MLFQGHPNAWVGHSGPLEVVPVVRIGATLTQRIDSLFRSLVFLHDERLEEEKRGVIRWLRPDYQIPRFAPKGAAPSELALVAGESAAASTVDERRPWPSTAVEQLAAVGAAVAQVPRSVDEVAAAFIGARKDLVARHLETLAMMGEIALDTDNRYRSALRVA